MGFFWAYGESFRLGIVLKMDMKGVEVYFGWFGFVIVWGIK